MSRKITCEKCGVMTVEWEEQAIEDRKLVAVTRRRDYYPISFVIRIRPDTATTYIVTPALERLLNAFLFHRIRSIDGGKSNYAIDVPLSDSGMVSNLLGEDGRIEEWHTEASAPVCSTHTRFVDKRW